MIFLFPRNQRRRVRQRQECRSPEFESLENRMLLHGGIDHIESQSQVADEPVEQIPVSVFDEDNELTEVLERNLENVMDSPIKVSNSILDHGMSENSGENVIDMIHAQSVSHVSIAPVVAASHAAFSAMSSSEDVASENTDTRSRINAIHSAIGQLFGANGLFHHLSSKKELAKTLRLISNDAGDEGSGSKKNGESRFQVSAKRNCNRLSRTCHEYKKLSKKEKAERKKERIRSDLRSLGLSTDVLRNYGIKKTKKVIKTAKKIPYSLRQILRERIYFSDGDQNPDSQGDNVNFGKGKKGRMAKKLAKYGYDTSIVDDFGLKQLKRLVKLTRWIG